MYRDRIIQWVVGINVVAMVIAFVVSYVQTKTIIKQIKKCRR